MYRKGRRKRSTLKDGAHIRSEDFLQKHFVRELEHKAIVGEF